MPFMVGVAELRGEQGDQWDIVSSTGERKRDSIFQDIRSMYRQGLLSGAWFHLFGGHSCPLEALCV